jgi:hypothetical protein
VGGVIVIAKEVAGVARIGSVRGGGVVCGVVEVEKCLQWWCSPGWRFGRDGPVVVSDGVLVLVVRPCWV